MNGLLKKWARRRHKSQQRRHDFSEDIRRAERREKLRRFAPIRWMQNMSAAVFRFREPKWAASRPMTKRGTTRLALARGSYLNPFVWIRGLVRFIASWIVSRPYGSMLPALPAVAVMLGIFGLVVWYHNAGRNWRDTMYRKHLNVAVRQKDFPVAMVSVNTLVDQNAYDPELLYQRALIAGELEQPQLSDYYMQQLAANDHVPAIFWVLTRHYNDGPVSNWDSKKQNRYAQYLKKLRDHARGDQLILARKLTGIYLSEMGLKTQAAEYLSQLANEQPDVLLSLSLLYREIGNESSARRYARDAQAYLQAALARDPMNATTRIHLAQAMLMTQDWDNSVQLLHEGRKLRPDNERLTKALAEALAGASLQPSNPDRMKPIVLDRRLKYAAAGLKVAPDNMLVLDAISRVLSETRQSPESETLRTSLLAGLDPGSLHFCEGTLALLDGREDEAIKHLRLAKSHGLNSPGILNNLAVAMSGRGKDLEEALRLVEGALEMLPEHPFVLETRGQIFVKMERYEEAVRDLETSLAGVKQLHLKKEIYPSLIKACQAIGLDETATRYQLLADKTVEVLDSQGGPKTAPTLAEQ